MGGGRSRWAGGVGCGGVGGFRQHFSPPLPSQLRGIVVESAAALFHSALQTLGSEYCVARWGKPAERGRGSVTVMSWPTWGDVSSAYHTEKPRQEEHQHGYEQSWK